MKVLHLFSNTKWTGPAEPVVNLCRALQERGMEVSLACSRTAVPGQDSSVAARARERGIRTITEFHLPKHMRLRSTLSDARRLRTFLQNERFDLVHAHTKNDHMTAALAVRRMTIAPPILRSSYEGDGLSPGLRNRLLLRKYTDGLITCSRKAHKANIDRFRFPQDRAWTVHGAVDTDEFSPDRDVPDLRGRFGLSKEHFVAGVVARIQARRKFDLLLEAVARAVRELDTLRVMIIGRGTHMRKVAVEPSRRLHLDHCVLFPGYFTGDDYIAALKCLDVKIYLFPGTDGTCRALLQAMATGKPAIVTKRGVLPEIIEDETEGFLVDDDPEHLANAIVRLGSRPDLRFKLGLNARKKVVDTFSLAGQASSIEEIYRVLLEKNPAGNA